MCYKLVTLLTLKFSKSIVQNCDLLQNKPVLPTSFSLQMDKYNVYFKVLEFLFYFLFLDFYSFCSVSFLDL